MKKRLLALMLLLCMVIGAFPASAEESTAAEETKMIFTDVGENHSAYGAILYLFENGIINGKSETLFYPEDFLKREEFAKILTKSLESPKTEGAPIYYDVPAGVWYADFVRSVSATGIMTGVSSTNFGVGLTLSRQDLAVVLKRFFEYTQTSVSPDTTVIYADSNKVSDYAREAVEFLSSCGIMPARANNMWCPKESATRAETAQALYNAIQIQKEQAASLGRYGDTTQYDPPYTVPTDDRVAEMMPTPFDANTWPQHLIASEDLEDGDFDVLKKGYWTSSAMLVEEGGYESDGCIKIEGQGQATLSWVASPEEASPGDYFALTAMVKGENIDSSAGGYYCNILAVNDENGKWLAEAHNSRQKASTDWTEIQQILMVPESVNALTQPEHYIINANLYVGNLTGTVYFDDVKLSKIKFDPMDTVLMEPVYKGIIKGEGGIGDISLRAYVNELNGLYDFDTMNFTAQITDENDKVYMKSETDTVTSAMDIHFSSASLPMGGDYWLESILTDKETGEVVQRQEWGLHKREADFETAIGVDEYGRVTRNGEPYFPISIYNWTNYNGVDTDIVGSEAIDNLMHSGTGWYLKFGTNENYRSIIEGLEKNNQTVSLGTGNLAFSYMYSGEVTKRVTKQEDVRGYLTKLVNNFKDLPNLFAYYIYDEQNAMRYGEEQSWVRKIVESLDLDHPTTCAIDNPIAFRKGLYAKTSDFLGYDPYPVTGEPNQDLSLVYDRLTLAKKINPNRPVYPIIQGFWYTGRKDLRGPTKEEFRNMIFQAIAAGSCMIDCYGYRAVMNSPSPGRTSAEEWADYRDVFLEIQYLEPIIISNLPAPYYEVKGGGEWLNTLAKRYDGKSYLFTVNNSSNENSAVLYLDGVKKITGMYSKKTYEADDSGYFEIEWDAYEAEVFEYEQSDYKSSHAELTTFGLADVILTDAESEISFFIIPEDKSEFEYNARISDYASLYINGEKVESTGKINLEGLSEIKVKVVSEDGRFTTERTFLIKRS